MSAVRLRRRASMSWMALVAVLLAVQGAATVAASVGASPAVQSSRPLGGGGASAGGMYQLQGAIAQHDASSTSTGGAFAVHGGVRRAREAPAAAVFSDGFE